MNSTAESPTRNPPNHKLRIKSIRNNRHEIRPCPDSHCSRRVSSLLCFSFAAVRFPCEAHPKKQELRSDQHAAQSNPPQPGTRRTRIESQGSFHPHPHRQTDTTPPLPSSSSRRARRPPMRAMRRRCVPSRRGGTRAGGGADLPASSTRARGERAMRRRKP